MQETAYPGQQPLVQLSGSTVQTLLPEPQQQQQALDIGPPAFRALPLLSSDLRHTTINVLHSFVRPNDRGKEVLLFVIFVNPGSGKEGWKVEKMYPDVQYLDVLVRKSVGKAVAKKIVNLPQGKLWVDHAPAKVDQRKAVLENYLQTLIQLPVKDNNEVIAFFTSNIVRDQKQSVMQAGYKEGYLTKRGKNFGGWKTRFFVLQGPVLEYYERRGGTHLGSIVVTGAQIGRQQQTKGPPSGDEKEYRHAFLVIEARKGPGGNHPRHVLCAESDEDRDSWVEILVRYFTGVYSDDVVYNPTPSPVNSVTAAPQQSVLMSQPRPIMSSNDLSGQSITRSSSNPIPVGGSSRNLAPGTGGSISLGVESDDYLRSSSLNSRSVDPSPISRQRPSGMRMGSDAYTRSVGNGGEQAKSLSFWSFGKANGDKLHLRAAGSPRAVFGVALEEALDVAQISNLPAIVFRTIQYLEAKKVDQEEGIYIESGSSSTIENLKDMFNSEGDVDLLASDENWDPHAIAGLLKSFLRELPSSVLTPSLYSKFIAIIDIMDPQERIEEVSRLISTLPLANYTLLRAITAHLVLIAQNSNVNKMTMRNLCIVFSPTLGIPVGVFSIMLGEFNRVFDDNAEDDDPWYREGEVAEENPPETLKLNSRQYSDTTEGQLLNLTSPTSTIHADDSQLQAHADALNYDTDDEEDSMLKQDSEAEEGEDFTDGGRSSSLSRPNEFIDFDLVYALHSFAATVEGQANVVTGDSLCLMDDSDKYWWLVRVIKTQEVGYVPAESIETPLERLARLNKHRNINLALPTEAEHDESLLATQNHVRYHVAFGNISDSEAPRRNNRQYSNATADQVFGLTNPTVSAFSEGAQSDDGNFIKIFDPLNRTSIPSGFEFWGKEAPSIEPSTPMDGKSSGRESEFLHMEEEEEEEHEQGATTGNPEDNTIGYASAFSYSFKEYVDDRGDASGIDRLAPNSTQTDIQLAEGNGLLHPMDGLSLDNSRNERSNANLSETILPSGNLMTHALMNAASPLDLSASVTRDTTHPVHGGSYADIYSGVLSRDEKTTKVAIKVIRAHIYTEANQWKINKRLKREIRVWSCLQHPNIVPLLGITQGFGPYSGMVCPWMSEGDLNHYLKDRRPVLSLQRRLQILSDIVEGLVYLHTRPIIHGDLSTGNILMEDGKAHLSDFGLSNLMAETRNGSLLTSTVGGAIRWAAPELYQIDTDPNAVPEITKPCDVYSLGCVGLEVISGKIPYYNITSDHQVLLKVMSGARPARPPEKLLTDAVWELITLCWTRDPDQRPSMEEVRGLLQNLIYGFSTDLLESTISS